ncbi:MAG: electron transport complex subunit E [Tissierellia bacterium]|nr:electron transport complex subunit E [Tissierellia bacterium]
MKLSKVFSDGIFKNNPILVQLIGLCGVLGVSTSVINALAMGFAVTIVLLGSNFVISVLRKAIPDKIRIPAFIVVIASFVTLIDMSLKAYAPAIYAQLGVFIPLIVVNCIILGRAEAFASKNSPVASIVDGLGTGIGYIIAITSLAAIRELFGSGKLLGFSILGASYPGIGIFTSPAGSFIILGIMIAAYRVIMSKTAKED